VTTDVAGRDAFVEVAVDVRADGGERHLRRRLAQQPAGGVVGVGPDALLLVAEGELVAVAVVGEVFMEAERVGARLQPPGEVVDEAVGAVLGAASKRPCPA
jgi:hypothetical protein